MTTFLIIVLTYMFVGVISVALSYIIFSNDEDESVTNGEFAKMSPVMFFLWPVWFIIMIYAFIENSNWARQPLSKKKRKG